MIDGFKGDTRDGWGTGLADTEAMALGGIKVGDNLLAVVSMTSAGATPVGRDVSDFTVGDGTLTAATIDLSNLRFWALWTSVPAS